MWIAIGMAALCWMVVLLGVHLFCRWVRSVESRIQALEDQSPEKYAVDWLKDLERKND